MEKKELLSQLNSIRDSVDSLQDCSVRAVMKDIREVVDEFDTLISNIEDEEEEKESEK